MLPADKTAALKRFLSQLPENAASKLARAVEADRRAGGNDLPHEVILDALRPKLRVEKVTPLRDPFDELETYMLAIRASRPADFNEDVLIENLTAFAGLSGSMLREFGTSALDRNALRLAKYREAVGDVMAGFMERAPRAIFAVLPMHKIGSFGLRSPSRLDLSRPPDGDKMALAKRFAKLLMDCRPLANPLSFEATFKPALKETIFVLRRYGDDIAREVRVSTPETRAKAEAHLDVALDLYAIVLGKQEAELLRRHSLSS